MNRMTGLIRPFMLGMFLGTFASVASAQFTAIDSFQGMPDGVFHNLICGGLPPFTIDVAGRQVVVTPSGSNFPPDEPYLVGCFNWSSSSFNGWRLPRDPAVDPGDFIGPFNSELDVAGDLILDFSEPLTSFGFSSFIGWCGGDPDPDTALLYDGPRATGNLLGSVTCAEDPTESCHISIDFVGLVGDTPQIRSVRIPLGGQGFMVDGIAVSVGPAGCPHTCGDLDGSGAVDLVDFTSFSSCMGEVNPFSPLCICADLDGSDAVDLNDFVAFATVFGVGSTNVPPNCP